MDPGFLGSSLTTGTQSGELASRRSAVCGELRDGKRELSPIQIREPQICNPTAIRSRRVAARAAKRAGTSRCGSQSGRRHPVSTRFPFESVAHSIEDRAVPVPASRASGKSKDEQSESFRSSQFGRRHYTHSSNACRAMRVILTRFLEPIYRPRAATVAALRSTRVVLRRASRLRTHVRSCVRTQVHE